MNILFLIRQASKTDGFKADIIKDNCLGYLIHVYLLYSITCQEHILILDVKSLVFPYTDVYGFATYVILIQPCQKGHKKVILRCGIKMIKVKIMSLNNNKQDVSNVKVIFNYKYNHINNI